MAIKPGDSLGWRRENFAVHEQDGELLFVAHHHSMDEVELIAGPYKQLHWPRGVKVVIAAWNEREIEREAQHIRDSGEKLSQFPATCLCISRCSNWQIGLLRSSDEFIPGFTTLGLGCAKCSSTHLLKTSIESAS
jgi:hypothetical protein